MKLFIPIVAVSLLFSCGTTKEVKELTSTEAPAEKEQADTTKKEVEEKKEEAVEDLRTEKSIEIKAHFGEFTESDDIQINSVVVSGNTLILNVTYSGGCEEHSFDMVGSQIVAKSLPPIRQIKLIHKNNDDHCRAMVSKTIIVDLREMAIKKEQGSEIILNLEGYMGRISYIFQ